MKCRGRKHPIMVAGRKNMNERLPKVAAALGCAYFLILIAVARIEGQIVTAEADKRASFVNESWSRLTAKNNSGPFRLVQKKADLWHKTKSEDDWVALTDAIRDAAEGSDTKSDVTIDTSAGTGATVKYQTLGQRKRNETPTTAKTPTESHESMYIGTYHIWSERGGKVTSDKNAQYEIANAKEKVVLVEQK